MSNDNTADALRRATNAVTVAGERLIGPEIDERTVALAMLASGVATLSRLMPAADLCKHMARLADGMGEPEARPLAPNLAGLGALIEDLSDMPNHAAIRDAVRAQIDAGTTPEAAVDALMAMAMSFSVEVDGPGITAVRFVAAGKVVADRAASTSAAPTSH